MEQRGRLEELVLDLMSPGPSLKLSPLFMVLLPTTSDQFGPAWQLVVS